MSEVIANNVDAAPGDAGEPPKSAKQLEKEAKKAAKLQKLQQKLDKKAAAPAPTKEKAEVITKGNYQEIGSKVLGMCKSFVGRDSDTIVLG